MNLNSSTINYPSAESIKTGCVNWYLEANTPRSLQNGQDNNRY